MSTLASVLLAAQARVEPQNGWLWLVVLAVTVVLLVFATVGWLHYRSGDRDTPATPPDLKV
jgi:hypothetical protein